MACKIIIIIAVSLNTFRSEKIDVSELSALMPACPKAVSPDALPSNVAYTERHSPRNACLTGGLGTFSRAGIPTHHRSHDPYAWTPGPSSPVDGATCTSYDSSIGDQSSQAMGPSASQGATAPPLRVSIFAGRVQSNAKETQLNCSQQSLPRFPALLWKKTAGLILYRRCPPPGGRPP